MKVFISWSGDRSKAVAEALRDWIPKVLQAVKPWISSQDIPKGGRWREHIATQLEDAKGGIICLTPENLSAEWILFEAGAIAKTLEDTLVCTYLLDVKPSDVRDPLAQFQPAKADKEDTRRLMQTINSALGKDALSEKQFDATFEKWWTDLEEALQKIPPNPPAQRKSRSQQDILEEILESVRALRKTIPDYSILPSALPPELAQRRLSSVLEALQVRPITRREVLMARLASQIEKEEGEKKRGQGPEKSSKD